MNALDEIVTIVDEKNNITGSLPRPEMRARKLPHRASYILVLNSKGKIFLQKRTLSKDVYPGFFDIAAGGVVLSGESYDECARRELAEEIGAKGIHLNFLFDFFHEDSESRVWGRVYSCIYDGKITIQEEEIESGEFKSPKDILEISKTQSFTPDGIYVLNRYLNEYHEKTFKSDQQIDFDLPVDRRQTSSMKWSRFETGDFISMWLADLDFESPSPVKRELVKRAQHGVFGYTVPPEALSQEIVQMLQNKYQWKIEPHWIVWLPGLVTGLNVACRCVGQDDDDVMTAIPVYPPFLKAPEYSRKNLITVPLTKSNDRWTFDFDALENAITPKTRIFILCNPHNPTGRIYQKDELNRLSEICLKHDVVICSDEIHCDLLLDQNKTHIPFATLSSEAAKKTITLMAPSKTYNLPGLGCSFAIIQDSLLKKAFQKAMSGIVPFVNIMGFTAALAAYHEGGIWLQELLQYLKKNHDYLYTSINDIPDLHMDPVEATYLAWIDIRQTGLTHPVRFFKKAGVILADGKEFGDPGFVRLNFGCRQNLLEQAIEKMKTAIKNR